MIDRPAYDEHGIRGVKCTRCGMVWLEHREPHELFPGEWTTEVGEREHTCPEPFTYEQALAIAHAAEALGGIVGSQRFKASVRLGLAAGPGSVRPARHDPPAA